MTDKSVGELKEKLARCYTRSLYTCPTPENKKLDRCVGLFSSECASCWADYTIELLEQSGWKSPEEIQAMISTKENE